MAKKPIAVRRGDEGDTTGVKFRGDQRVTPLKTAVKMAERGDIPGYHAVHGKSKDYIRATPDGTKRNNIDDLPDA